MSDFDPLRSLALPGSNARMGYQSNASWREWLMNWLFARKGCFVLTVVGFALLVVVVFFVVPAFFMGEPPCVTDNPPCLPYEN